MGAWGECARGIIKMIGQRLQGLRGNLDPQRSSSNVWQSTCRGPNGGCSFHHGNNPNQPRLGRDIQPAFHLYIRLYPLLFFNIEILSLAIIIKERKPFLMKSTKVLTLHTI